MESIGHISDTALCCQAVIFAGFRHSEPPTEAGALFARCARAASLSRSFSIAISKANVVSDLSASEAHLGARSVESVRPTPGELGAPTLARRFLVWFWNLTNAQLALVLSVGLFSLAAWPLALTEVPPLQDLPNHLAAITVIKNPGRYPEFVFNGFMKTNTALFAWLYFVGNVVGTKVAARLFVALVLAANALVYSEVRPRVDGEPAADGHGHVLRLAIRPQLVRLDGDARLRAGGPPLAPRALAPRQTAARMELEPCRRDCARRRRDLVRARVPRSWSSTSSSASTCSAGTSRGPRSARPCSSARVSFASSCRSYLALCSSCPRRVGHTTEATGAMYGYVNFSSLLPPWELVYNLWAEWLWGFTKLSISSFVVAVGLAALAFVNRRERPGFFGPWSFLTLLAHVRVHPVHRDELVPRKFAAHPLSLDVRSTARPREPRQAHPGVPRCSARRCTALGWESITCGSS